MERQLLIQYTEDQPDHFPVAKLEKPGEKVVNQPYHGELEARENLAGGAACRRKRNHRNGTLPLGALRRSARGAH